jgi:SAM-dependent methyltransferase
MYELIKRLGKLIIPEKMLKRNEARLRAIVAMRYKGDRYACNICGFRLSKFISLANGEQLCPRCGSLPRTRRLWHLLADEVAGKSILHFSPPSNLKEKLKKSGAEKYSTTDYANEFVADKQLDITQIEEADESYDLVICYHVLEHIEQDQKAMSELYRILKTGGKCMIQTPFKEGDIYENELIQSPAERLAHFGQADHVRIYSIEGLKKRLEEAGFKVEILDFAPPQNNHFGYKNKETVLIANKIK